MDKRKIPLTIVTLALPADERARARRRHWYRVRAGETRVRSRFWFEHDLFGKPVAAFPDHAPGDGRAMADNEAEGGAPAETAEAAPARSNKLKLIVAAVGFLALGGGASWFFLIRGHGEEPHAEAAAAKPPVFVEVPEMLVNLVGLPGDRVQYLKVKVVLEVREEK